MKPVTLFVVQLAVLGAFAFGDEVFGAPENLDLNTVARESAPCISADGLSLYFDSDRPGGYGGDDIWVAKRGSLAEAWQQRVNLGPNINTTTDEYHPCLSPDGLQLYFGSDGPGGCGGYDLWVTTRSAADREWATPANLGSVVNSRGDEVSPCISPDGLHLYFSDYPHSAPRSGGLGQADIWVASRPNTSSPWGEPVNLGPVVNSSAAECRPDLSADGLMLFFSSDRDGGQGWDDIWQIPIVSRQAFAKAFTGR